MKTAQSQTVRLAAVLGFMAIFLLGHAGLFTSSASGNDHDQTAAPPGRQIAPPRLGRVLFAANFPYTGLVSNDYDYFNPGNPNAVRSPDWIVTSGSLFAHDGAGSTGTPDATKPNADSSNGTGSAILRVVTRRRHFNNVAVSFDLLNQRYTTTTRTPARSWDGIHLFLHYHSQHSLYALSINRRDNTVLVKKKVPGGPANGGSYHTLGTPTSYTPTRRWQHILATITSNPNATVTISLYINGQHLLTQTDTGSSGRPLTGPGAIGLRGDNTQFQFANFRVSTLAASRIRTLN